MIRNWKNTIKPFLYIGAALLATVCILIQLVGPGWQQIAVHLGLAPSTVPPEHQLEVHFLDVGNADCTLVRYKEYAVLIDAGERGDGEAVVRYLQAHGVDKLDLVIATHAHADHIGGMAQVLDAFSVSCFFYSPPVEEESIHSPAYRELMTALQSSKITPQPAQAGMTFALGEVNLTVLSPSAAADTDNAMSVVLRLTYGSHAFLLTGDAGEEVENSLVYSGVPLQADVLKVGHHGSDTSSSGAFLRVVSPTYAVIPCGAGNTFGHPAEAVLTALVEQGADVYRSDVHGTVVFTTDGRTLTVKTEKG